VSFLFALFSACDGRVSVLRSPDLSRVCVLGPLRPGFRPLPRVVRLSCPPSHACFRPYTGLTASLPVVQYTCSLKLALRLFDGVLSDFDPRHSLLVVHVDVFTRPFYTSIVFPLADGDHTPPLLALLWAAPHSLDFFYCLSVFAPFSRATVTARCGLPLVSMVVIDLRPPL